MKRKNMKRKNKYVIEITTIDLIPCETKREMKMYLLKHGLKNLVVYTQKEFKEIYK